MKFEVGQKYRHKPTEQDVIYVGPSADKEYAVFEGPYGDYDSDVWNNFEVIKEPRRFWIIDCPLFPQNINSRHLYATEEAAQKNLPMGWEIIPVIEVLPDEDTSL